VTRNGTTHLRKPSKEKAAEVGVEIRGDFWVVMKKNRYNGQI
jgi:hypothetical protein